MLHHRINTDCPTEHRSGVSNFYAESGGAYCLNCDEWLGRIASRTRVPAYQVALAVRMGAQPSLRQRIQVSLWRLARRVRTT